MRLWHYLLIPKLSTQRLLGQHRECCALRGRGWGKKHATVDYVFKYPKQKLFFYHLRVMIELMRRGVNVERTWLSITYQGRSLPEDRELAYAGCLTDYAEHNDDYLQECITNLHNKGEYI